MTKVVVDRDEYLEILGFTTYAFLTEKITKYSGITGGQRALGEYIENFVYGKVAEVAFKNFLEKNYNIEVLTDLDLEDFILGVYLPDLVAFKSSQSDWEVVRFWIDVKEIRRDQRWLLVPKVSSQASPRLYDAYVAVWVGLPDEHLYWIISQVKEIGQKLGNDWMERAKDLASKVNKILCEVKGFVLWEDINLMENAKKGEDIALHKAEGIIDMKMGKIFVVMLPLPNEGGSKTVDYEKLRVLLSKLKIDKFASLDIIGKIVLEKIGIKSYFEFAPLQASINACERGLNILIAGSKNEAKHAISVIEEYNTSSMEEIDYKIIYKK